MTTTADSAPLAASGADRPPVVDFLAGGGEMGALVRAHDWSATPLGPIEAWPQSLRTATGILLRSPVPIVMLWGEDGVMLYNDAYSAFAGGRHPRLLGSKLREGWPEVADFNDNVMKVGLAGATLSYRDQELTLHRHGRPEQVFMDLDYSPVLGESGAPAGVMAIVVETTGRVLAERRQAFRLRLEERLRGLADPKAAMASAAEALGLHLGVGRVGYGEVDASGTFLDVERDWTDGAMPSLAGRLRLDDFGEAATAEYRSGGAVRVADVLADARTRGAREAYEAIGGPRSGIGVPLLKDGRLVAVLFVHQATPRCFTDEEEALVREVADRTWSAVERARAEAELRESEARFRALVNATAYVVYRMGPDWREMRRLDGAGFVADTDEPRTDWIGAYIPPEERVRVGAAIARATETKGMFELEHRVLRVDGTLGWMLSRAVPLLDEAGEIAEWFGTASDVTARKEAELALAASDERLRASEALFRTLAEAMPTLVFMADADGANTYTNPQFQEYAGVTAEALLGDGWLDVVHPDDRAHVAETWAASRRGGEAYNAEYRFRRRDGAYRWHMARGRPVRDPEGRITTWVGAGIDVHDAFEARAALERANETLERRIADALAERKLWVDVFETTDALIGLLDPGYRFLALNRAYADEFERIYGLRPDVGDCLLDLLAGMPEHLAAARAVWGRALAGEEFTLVETFGDEARARPCYELRFNVLRDRDGRIAGAYQYAVDVSERERNQMRLTQAEAQLRQAQKMEAVGQLTGGVAHDFNNLLQALAGCLKMIERKAASPEVKPLVDAGRQAVDRGARLVQQLMAFARKQALSPVAVDVRDRVLGMSELLARALRGGIRLETEFEADLWPVLADPVQLELAVINLAVNARDAMPEGGVLRIEARNVPAGGEGGVEMVRVSVTDTGTGMPPDVLDRAFEPFFTTKGVGEGSGLGLSQVYGFARQIGGSVSIESGPGRGTTVTLLLPRTRETAAEAAPEPPVGRMPTRGARILLVEDDPMVAGMTAAALAEAGYEVAQVPSADEALPLLRGGASVDVLFSDVVMPGRLNGVDLAQEARRLRPGLPVVLTTGYSEHVARAAGVRVLSKPYEVGELVDALEAALGRPDRDAAPALNPSS
jgi:PAS domain S-box-containing protein